MSIIRWNNDSLPSGIRLSEVINSFMSVTCASRHQLLQTHKTPAGRLACLKSAQLKLAGSHAEPVTQQRCRFVLSCERWELRCWQQIWQANLMTSHLRLGGQKQTPTPASSLLRGIWKRKLHQTSNAGNESNWEKVCPGSEGCEEVVEREHLWNSREGIGALKAQRARKSKCWESLSKLGHKSAKHHEQGKDQGVQTWLDSPSSCTQELSNSVAKHLSWHKTFCHKHFTAFSCATNVHVS